MNDRFNDLILYESTYSLNKSKLAWPHLALIESSHFHIDNKRLSGAGHEQEWFGLHSENSPGVCGCQMDQRATQPRPVYNLGRGMHVSHDARDIYLESGTLSF